MKEKLRELYAAYLIAWLSITSRQTIGTNIFESDWDILIILDACRTDALREVESEYEFLQDVDQIWSVGSTSMEWMQKTFVREYEEEISNTAYITANTFSNVLTGDREKLQYGAIKNTRIQQSSLGDRLINYGTVRAEDFAHIEPLWADADSNDKFQSTQKPGTVTDHTVKAARNSDFDRVVAHYMQPHAPYFSTSKEYPELNEYEKYPFRFLKTKSEKEKVWESYIDNLRYVLDHVERLLKNADGDVVITADHGELFGRQGIYSHIPGLPHPRLKRVPWVQTEATDTNTVNPSIKLNGVEAAQEVSEEQLEALGYLD